MVGVPRQVQEFIYHALAEDIGHGDVTTDSTVSQSLISKAEITTKQDAVIAGLDCAHEVFAQVDPSVRFRPLVKDGQRVGKGRVIARIQGPTRGILKGERLSLNILQRLSGIATLTRRFVERVKGFPVKIVDTRKTTPGMRYLEKYAVRTGGGGNHRFGLYDGILVKDNHIRAARGIRNAVHKARSIHHLLKIEVEVKDLRELKEALKAGVDVIMLDNMSIEMMKKAVSIVRGKKTMLLLEASGNVSLETVRDIASTGVDLISVGAITHSAPAVDLSLKIAPR